MSVIAHARSFVKTLNIGRRGGGTGPAGFGRTTFQGEIVTNYEVSKLGGNILPGAPSAQSSSCSSYFLCTVRHLSFNATLVLAVFVLL